MTAYGGDLELARRLGEIADELSMRYFRNGVRYQWKEDGSPVTEADLAVERALLEVLAAERPDDMVLSEERGTVGARTGRRWLLDPIDGTSYFLGGSVGWGTHVALEVDGEIVVGLISRPALGRSWYAAKGEGAWSSTGDRLQVTDRASLDGARVSGFVQPWSRWVDQVLLQATWVDSHAPIIELVEGRVDAVLSEGGYEWDHAPAVVLVHEAGGRFTDPDGGQRIDRRGGLYANGRIDAEVLAVRPRW